MVNNTVSTEQISRIQIDAADIDMWMGPQYSSPEPALDNCEDYVTENNATVIINPDKDYPVDTTPMFSNGQCSAVVYND